MRGSTAWRRCAGMVLSRSWKSVTTVAAACALALAVVACGSDSGGSGAGGNVTLSYLVDNSEGSVKPTEALIKAFEAKNPTIKIKMQTRPQGGDGDNLVKTQLSTQSMADMFAYNSGSLFQALHPEQQLQPLSDQPWVKDLDKAFTPAVTANGQVYGAPNG